MQMAVLFSVQTLFSGLLNVGMMAAGMAISLLTRQHIMQPIQDLKVSVSAYGRAIARTYGSWRCTGNMFWATDLRLVRVFEGPKGKQMTGSKGKKKFAKGEAQEVNTYYADFAMGLCVGPKADVLRIWCDSNLIFDKYNPIGYFNSDGVWVPVVQTGFSLRPPVTGPGVTNLTKADQKNLKKAPAQEAFTFRFYGGDESQLQDPTMAAASGAAFTPAYRGLCYLFFPNLGLRDFGNRIPTVTAEVVPALNPLPSVSQWTLMVDPPFDVTGNNWSTFVDYNRARLAQVDSVLGGPNNGQYCVRVWDIQQQVEINRLLTPNPPLGFDANGDLVTANYVSGVNNTTFTTINPNSGGPGQPLIAPVVLAIFATSCQPILGLDENGNLISRTVMTTAELTVVVVESGKQIYAPYGNLSAGQGNPGSGAECVYWGTGKASIGGLTVNDWGSDDGIFINLPDPSAGKIFPPIWSVGADAFLVMWEGGSGFAAAGFDITGKQLWTVPLPFGPSFLYRVMVPIIQGISYSFFGTFNGGGQSQGGTVCSINIQTGALLITEVDTGSIPELSGPQLFNEGGPSITYWSGGNGVLGPDWYTLFFNSFTAATTPLSQVLTDVMEQVGVPAAKINTSVWLSDAPVEGFAVDNVTSARKVIEDLAQVFMFDVTESDNILKVVSRGQNPLAVVTQSQLGIVGKASGPSLTDSEASNHFYEETRMQEIDLPQRVDISFVDPAREYEAGTTGYSRPSSPFPTMQSNALMQVNLPIALSEQTAQQWAETICYAAWIERIHHKFTVPPEFLVYDPTDVLFFNMDDGLTFCDRLTRIDISSDFSIAVETVDQVQPYYLTPGVSPVVEDLYSPYRPVSIGFSPGSTIPAVPVSVAGAKPILMDTPLQSDSDAGKAPQVPFYWGAGAFSPGFTNGLLSTRSGAAPFEADGATNTDIPWGGVPNAVPSPPEGAFATDKTSQIILAPEMDYEAAGTYNWESLTDIEWPSEANMILIGQEIICFKNVVINADKTVTISTLLRGWRGTEDFAYNHVAGEQFTILGQSGDRLGNVPTTDVNQPLTGTLFGTNLLQLIQPTVTIAFKGNSLRPYAPVGMFRADDITGSTITWNRRTRYNGSLQEGSGVVPLNEDSELYRLYICNTAPDPATFDPTNPANYVREVDGLTSALYLYPAATMVTDGFSALQTFWVVVYQISGEVGLGFPGVAEMFTNTPVYA